MRRPLSFAVVLSALGAVVMAPAAAAATCAPTVLPNPPGATASAVTGTDDAGTYVGIAHDGSDSFGVRWRDGQVERLPENFLPYDMNTSGVMSGSAELRYDPYWQEAAAQMTPDGTMTYLSVGNTARAAGLNERRDSVGWLFPEHPIMHLTTIWRGGAQGLELLDNDWYAPRDIDDDGRSVGGEAGSTKQRVWDFHGTVLREFGPYGENDARFELADIDDGRIAATRVEPNGQSQVFILGLRAGRDAPLPGSAGGHAVAFDNGVVVGGGPQGAMMWRRTSATVLPAPDGMTASEATVVNGDGTEAAGISVSSSGEKVATVWRC